MLQPRQGPGKRKGCPDTLRPGTCNSVPFPAGYEVVRANGLQALYRDGHCVSVFSADTPAALIIAAAVRDAAHRAGISARDLQIALAVLTGESAEDVGRQWGLLPAQILSIASAIAGALWPGTTIEEHR